MRRPVRQPPPGVASPQLVLALLALMVTAPLVAQQPPPNGAGVVQPWSPGAPAASLTRTLPGAPAMPSLLLAPAPIVGAFWSTGNPGAVAFDVARSRARYGLGWRQEKGTYRRPLDPAASRAATLDFSAWQRVGEHGAAAGRVTAEQESLDPSSFAHLLDPYGSSPLVPTDSSTPAVRRVSARLEGVLGWRLGSWGVGAGLGYVVSDLLTEASKLPRIGRLANPAVSAGLVRRFRLADLTVGLVGRYYERIQEYRIIARGANGTAYPLTGLTEPSPLVITSISSFFRRIEQSARAYGLTLGGRVAGVSFAGYAADEHLREEQIHERQENPPVDTWVADGWSAGLAAQGRPPRVGALVTGHARYAKLQGDARRLDLEGIVVRGRESALELAGEVRWATPDSAWYLSAAVTTRHESRVQLDYVAELRSDIGSWLPGAAVEIARRVGPGTRVAFGAAYAGHYAASTMPNPTTKGPIYQLLIAPELSLGASQAQAVAGQATLVHRLRGATSAWVRLSYERLAPTDTPGQSTLPLRPNGDRKGWSVSLGLVTN